MDELRNDPTGILVAVRAGSAPVFGALFDEYAPRLLRYLRWGSGGSQDPAEDMLSLLFLEAWRCRDRAVLVDGSLLPWLYGIGANLIRSERRARRRHAAALARYHAARPEASVPDHADAVVTAAGADERATAVHDAFASLTPKVRETARLCLLEGLTAIDAAAALAIPVGTVKSRLARARNELRRLLRPGGSCDLKGWLDHEPERHQPGVAVTRQPQGWRAT